MATTKTDIYHIIHKNIDPARIRSYVKKNKIKRLILVTDNASFHVSRKTKQFIEN
ncbi:MAG: hypothetical protein WAK17_03605 [Candidatus Nitrosopolaris sp.]